MIVSVIVTVIGYVIAGAVVPTNWVRSSRGAHPKSERKRVR
jgi:hypothetical protein